MCRSELVDRFCFCRSHRDGVLSCNLFGVIVFQTVRCIFQRRCHHIYSMNRFLPIGDDLSLACHKFRVCQQLLVGDFSRFARFLRARAEAFV